MTDIQNLRIIGIDCAADPKNIAVAFADKRGDTLSIHDVEFGKGGAEDRSHRLQALAKKVRCRISGPTLLALDAPLGWPASMGDNLKEHHAGLSEGLPEAADDLFQRQTDQFVAWRTGKTPLEVGANLIARVTHTALRLLEYVIPDRSERRPLSGRCHMTHGVNTIEVYPALAGPKFLRSEDDTGPTDWDGVASDLKAMKAIKSKVGKPEDFNPWPQVCKKLEDKLSCDGLSFEIDTPVRKKKESKRLRDHGLDAILCAWIGARFLAGQCEEPPENICDDILAREGWIWFDGSFLPRPQRASSACEKSSA